MNQNSFDVVVIGAGAAGLMCAIESSKRHKNTLLIEHRPKPGGKILISGGGFCNFTNLEVRPDNYVSQNPHFCKSTLKQYDQRQFIRWVEQRRIPYREKKLGQLFCKSSAKDILAALLEDLHPTKSTLSLSSRVKHIVPTQDGFALELEDSTSVTCASLVIATGGLSIPKMGATGFAYDQARKFGHRVENCDPALVGYLFSNSDLKKFSGLQGISADCQIECNQSSFRENLLFIHAGLSGPSILQSSLYWHHGDSIKINFLPDTSIQSWRDRFATIQSSRPKMKTKNVLSKQLPKRLVERLLSNQILEKEIAQLSKVQLNQLEEALLELTLIPSKTVGFKKAEVTRGGISTEDISSKTMESKLHKGLFFIGEALDVTGWLGGYNFQWAWSSGWVAGQHV